MSERLRIISRNDEVPASSIRDVADRTVRMISATDDPEQRRAIAMAYLTRARRYQQTKLEEALQQNSTSLS